MMSKKSILSIGLASLLISFLLISSSVIADDNSAGYTRTITINSGQVPSPQTDFPLLVFIDHDPDLQAHIARADGGDIYFSDAAGSVRYPHEIEKYDKSTGTLTAWVKIPSLTDGAVIKMQYGLDTGSPQWSPEKVWDSHYKMVQHMDEFSAAAPQLKDSTANNNSATYEGKPAAAAGKIGGAINFPGASYINCGTDPSLNFVSSGTYTWGAWINPRTFQQGGSGIIGKKQTPNVDSQGYEIALGGTGGGGGSGPGQLRFQTSGGSSSELGAANFYMPQNEWVYVLATYDQNANISLFINGNFNKTGTMKILDDTASPLYIGWRRSANSGPNVGFFAGLIDEVRLSDVARSADWILAEYRNQSAPGSFYAISAETREGIPDITVPVGLILNSGTADFKTLIDPATGKTLKAYSFYADDKNASINVTADTVSLDKAGRPLNELNCLPVSNSPAEISGNKVVAAYDFGPEGATFSPPAMVSIKYDEAAIPTGVARGDLVLAEQDSSGNWTNLSGISVNTLNQIVTGKTDRLGRIAILAPPAVVSNEEAENFETGSGPNWWLISINLVVVAAALFYIFFYRSIRKKNKPANK